MKHIITLLLILVNFTGFTQEQQEKYQRAKINYSEASDLSRLATLGIPVEHGTHKRGHYVISDFSVSEIEIIRNSGYQVEVLIDDSKAYFLQQNELGTLTFRNPTCGTVDTEYETPNNFELGSMGGYLTYQELLTELDEMRAAYPNLITAKEDISNFLTEGTPDASTTPSIGSNGIKWVKISDNPDSTTEGEPQILYTALHHAREPAGLSQLVFYMWYLLENYDSDPEVKAILDNTELFFVPVLNPDGYLYNEKTDPNGGGFWRKNRKNSYGTDLNRNYDYYINGDSNNGVWGGEGASANTSSQVYHGPTPFSEIETQAIKWFVENHNFTLAFNNHTYGDLLLYPYGYTDNVPTPENDLFAGISAELVSQNGFDNIISSGLYPAAGDSDDFMYGTVNTHSKIYAFTPEIGSAFWPPSNQIESISKGMMYLNLTAAKMTNNYAKISDTAPSYTGNNLTAIATFSLERLGLSGNGNFTVTLTPVSGNIVSSGAPLTYTAMNVLDVENGSILYNIEASTVAGDAIIYSLSVDNGLYTTSEIITKKFGALSTIFEDEGNSVDINFTNNGWGTTTSTFVSPSSSITDSPSGNYQNNESKFITLSEPINLTDALGATVSFFAKWEIENNFDYVQFEISTDGGTTWTAQCGNFTNAGSTNGAQPTGEPLYDGVQNDWVQEEIDLSDYLGENIVMRFQFNSDNGQRADGFYFDDLKVHTVDENILLTSENITTAFHMFPNPLKNTLTINSQLINYDISVYNLQGQLIAERFHNSKNATFDFSNLSSGLYILRASTETITETFKIVKK
jgi:hypothetical protein